MKYQTIDPIVEEVRTARDRHAAEFNYDLARIFRDIRRKQKASDQHFVKYPSRPVRHPLEITA